MIFRPRTAPVFELADEGETIMLYSYCSELLLHVVLMQHISAEQQPRSAER